MSSDTTSVLRHKKTHNLPPMTLEEMAKKKVFIIIMNIMAIFGNAQMMTANQGYNEGDNILKQMNIVEKYTCELSTRSEISASFFWPVQTSACRKILYWLENCSLFQWRQFWMYWEERCVCLCLEGLRRVTQSLGRNCRGNLEVFVYWGSWFYGNSQICILSSLWTSSFFRTAESNFYSLREMTWLRSLDMANKPVWRDFDWEWLEAQNFTKPKKY